MYFVMIYVNLNEHFVIFKQYPTPYSARVVQYIHF